MNVHVEKKNELLTLYTDPRIDPFLDDFDKNWSTAPTGNSVELKGVSCN